MKSLRSSTTAHAIFVRQLRTYRYRSYVPRESTCRYFQRQQQSTGSLVAVSNQNACSVPSNGPKYNTLLLSQKLKACKRCITTLPDTFSKNISKNNSISRFSTSLLETDVEPPKIETINGSNFTVTEIEEPIKASSSQQRTLDTDKTNDSKNIFHQNNQTYDSMMELYDILMSKQIGAFRFPTDYNVYAISFIRYVVHLNTTSFYGNAMNKALSSTNSNISREITNDDMLEESLPDTTPNTNTSNTNNINSHVQLQRDQEAIRTVIVAAFRLWERTTYEYSLRRFNNTPSKVVSAGIQSTAAGSSTNNQNNYSNDDNILWLHSSRIFDKLLLKWKKVALSSIRTIGPSTMNRKILSPMEVLQIVQTISNHNRNIENIVLFDNDISVYNTILQVLLAQYQKESCYTAPIQVDKFIHQYLIRPAATAMSQREQQRPNTSPAPPPPQYQPPSTSTFEPLSQKAIEFNRKTTDPVYNKIYKPSCPTTTILKPNIYTYTLLLRAWIQSEHPMSLQEVEYIMTTIQDIYWYEKNVVPNLHNNNTDENNDDSANNNKPVKGSAKMDILTPHMLAIRFYANMGDIKEVDAIFNYVQRIDDLPTNDQYGLFVSEMIHSFCMRTVVTESGYMIQEKHLKHAEDLFHVLVNSVINVQFEPTSRKFIPVPLEQYSPDTIKAVMTSANSIMNTYRLMLRPVKKQVIIASPKHDDEIEGDGDGTSRTRGTSKNDEMIARAENFLQQIEKFEPLDRESFGKLRLPLMDMYAKMYKLQQAENMFEKYRDGDDNHPHAILIKAYSNCNQPERAEQLVQSMLRSESQRNMVDIEIINCLICAWAECSTSNRTVAADHAHQIYRWMYDHPIVLQLKIRPNFDTYSLLFDCMAKAGSVRSFNGSNDNNPRNKVITSGIASKVEALLNEIESRYLMGGDINFRPDVTLYNCAIQACLNCKEYDQAEYILQLMEHRMSAQKQAPSDVQKVLVVPDIRSYILLLNCYSKLGTITGAEWTEQLHNHMRKLSETINPLLKPTVSTYNIVMSGWAASGASDVTDRVWKIYEQMTQVDEIELDAYNYTTLISALSKSKTSNGIQRAIELLQIMQTKAKSSPGQSKIHPDGRQYCLILKACVDVNDVDNAAYVMNLYIDAYLMRRCRPTDHPDRSIFHWIISTWITRNELTLASWFMFDTVTAVMKANNIPMNSSNVNSPNTPFATPAIVRTMKTIGVDPPITSKLSSAWRESTHPQHLTEKEKYLTKIKTMITQPLFESQRQQYHKRFQRPDASSDSITGSNNKDKVNE